MDDIYWLVWSASIVWRQSGYISASPHYISFSPVLTLVVCHVINAYFITLSLLPSKLGCSFYSSWHFRLPVVPIVLVFRPRSVSRKCFHVYRVLAASALPQLWHPPAFLTMRVWILQPLVVLSWIPYWCLVPSFCYHFYKKQKLVSLGSLSFSGCILCVEIAAWQFLKPEILWWNSKIFTGFFLVPFGKK